MLQLAFSMQVEMIGAWIHIFLWANNGSWMDYKSTESHTRPLWPVSKVQTALSLHRQLVVLWWRREWREKKRLQWPASYATVALLGGAGAHWSHAKGTHSMSNSTDICFKNIVQRQHVPSIAIYVHFLSRIVSLCIACQFLSLRTLPFM